MKNVNRILTAAILLLAVNVQAQLIKQKSYIISKEKAYTIDVRDNEPSVVAETRENAYVGDKANAYFRGSRIGYIAAFEEVSDIEAFSMDADKKKVRVRNIYTEDAKIENIFHHDMKFKTFVYSDLIEGSETYLFYRKIFKKPQFLEAFYFRDGIETKDSKIKIKVSNDIEIGYVLHGNDTEKVAFSSKVEGNYTTYCWQLLNAEKDELIKDAPTRSYWSPHLIFYIKNYKSATGQQSVVGSVKDLYAFYYAMTSNINKIDQSAIKEHTTELTRNLVSATEKAKAIFNFVQSKVQYVAFEEGMGGFIPRDAADVFQKKYGDCKDISNLLNEMLNYAGIESYLAWIGTRANNYTYENVPSPIVDNHMITVAQIDGKPVFLDGTGQYTLFPDATAFIQEKQALLRLGPNQYKVLNVPIVPASENKMTAKINVKFDGKSLSGDANIRLTGYLKSQFNNSYQHTDSKEDLLRNYLSRFINQMAVSNIAVANADLTQEAIQITHQLSIVNWAQESEGKLLFKPALLFPYADGRVADDRKVPVEFPFNNEFDLSYTIEIPTGYTVEYLPAAFRLKNDLLEVSLDYVAERGKITVHQTLTTNVLLLENHAFSEWNHAVKKISKQYNQNIILTKS